MAFAAALAASLAVAFAQPLDSPWWTYADADASYAASAANLMAGEHTLYLDHPGVPLQSLMAVTFEFRYLAHRLFGGDKTPHAYAAERLRHLDDSSPYWRSFAILFWLLGAAAAFLVATRLLGHWGFGLGAGLLWVGAPGLAEMSIQYRPEVLLTGLVLVVAYLIARAAEERDAWLYALATLVLGFAMTVELAAAGLLVPLVLAVTLRPPLEGWPGSLLERLRALVARHRSAIAVVVAGWIAIAVVFNRRRFPFETSASEHRVLAYVFIGLGAYLALSILAHQLGLAGTLGRVLTPFAAVLGLMLFVGVFVPALPFLDDGLLMLVKMKDAAAGAAGGGIDAFQLDWNRLGDWPLRQALVVGLLAAAGAAVGVAKRDSLPVLWFAGAVAMGVIAAARPDADHYFAPSYVLSILPALWLFRARGAVVATVATALVVGYVLVPQAEHLRQPAERAGAEERQAAAAQRLAAEIVKPKEIALSESYLAAVPDIRYHDFVAGVASYAPDYPYRFVPDSPAGRESARTRELRLSHYIGRLPLRIKVRQRITLGAGGSYEVRPLPELADPAGVGALELLRGEGVDRPYRYPNAPYDPWTGHYTFEKRYYDFWGNEVVNPARRKYVRKLGLWLDAYGDFWNAQGVLVMSKPELRTAK